MGAGPNDPSILYLQNNHRSSNEELMESDKCVTIIDHSGSVSKVTSSHPGVLEQLRIAGFLQFFLMGNIQIDHNLITSLLDRWRPETCTFHLKVGEMTIILKDVAILLGLRVSRQAVTGAGNQYDYFNLCEHLLGILPPQNSRWGNNAVGLTWFRQQFSDPLPADASDLQIRQRARAIILHMFACKLFVDHSKSRVSLEWLPYLNDLVLAGKMAWGSAVLADTFCEMSNASLGRGTTLSGCMSLVQLWCWTYLPVGKRTMKRQTIDNTLPFGSRWVGAKSTRATSVRSLRLYRNEFDTLENDAVSWTPYYEEGQNTLPQICFEGMDSWLARVPIICLYHLAFHLPDRVMRQYGFIQHIPDPAPPFVLDQSGIIDACILEWHERVMVDVVERYPPLPLEDYMSWYFNITRRYILKRSEVVQSYTPRAPLERDVVDGMYAVLDLASQISDEADNEATKGKCLGIKNILDTLLCRNRLARPRPPTQPPQPPREETPPHPRTERTYQRRGKGHAVPSQSTQADEQDATITQPPASQVEEEDEIEADEQLIHRPKKKTPRMVKELRY